MERIDGREDLFCYQNSGLRQMLIRVCDRGQDYGTATIFEKIAAKTR